MRGGAMVQTSAIGKRTNNALPNPYPPCYIIYITKGDQMKIGDLIKVGDLVRYKTRYIGEQFVVVGVRNHKLDKYSSDKYFTVKCVSAKTLKETRWSCSSTFTVLA